MKRRLPLEVAEVEVGAARDERHDQSRVLRHRRRQRQRRLCTDEDEDDESDRSECYAPSIG